MPESRTQNGVFITGTDTGVGKTHIGKRLIQALLQLGISVQPRKPAESGCNEQDGQLIPSDGHELMQAAELSDIDTVTPFRFRHPLSPPRAASLSGKSLSLRELIDACNADPAYFRVIEGAGGFLSPIADNGLNADLAQALGLPVILVVADKLGCVNHCLLTLEAIEHRGLDIAAIVVNQINATDPDMDNLGEIKRLTENTVYADSDLLELAQEFT
jgi:dethiobiotin synthetase